MGKYFLIFFKKYIYIYLFIFFLAALGFRCDALAFSMRSGIFSCIHWLFRFLLWIVCLHLLPNFLLSYLFLSHQSVVWGITKHMNVWVPNILNNTI